MAPSPKLFHILRSSSHLLLILLLFPQTLVFPPLGSIREKCLFPWVALGGKCEEVMYVFTFVSFAWPQWTTAADGCSQFIVLDVLSIGFFLWLLDDLQVPSWDPCSFIIGWSYGDMTTSSSLWCLVYLTALRLLL